MLIVVLFTIARTWKQPKCPSTEEWIKKICYLHTHTHTHTHTLEYYLATKRNEIVSSTETWVDQETVI